MQVTGPAMGSPAQAKTNLAENCSSLMFADSTTCNNVADGLENTPEALRPGHICLELSLCFKSLSNDGDCLIDDIAPLSLW